MIAGFHGHNEDLSDSDSDDDDNAAVTESTYTEPEPVFFVELKQRKADCYTALWLDDLLKRKSKCVEDHFSVALVSHQASALRSPEPAYSPNKFLRRSTYVRKTSASPWMVLEDHVRYGKLGKRQNESLKEPVADMVTVFL